MFFELAGNRVEVSPRTRERDARLEPADSQIAMVTAIARQLGRDRERRVNLSALWIIKLLRHHANDRSDNAIGLDCLIDNVRVAAEAALPQTVSEQGYSIFAWLILFSRETAAQQGLHADDIKKCGSVRLIISLGRNQ